MQTLIERHYQVMQALDHTDDGQPCDFQPASSPNGDGSVREVATLAEAVALMKECFDKERAQFPEEVKPEDFRIEVTERHHLDVKPSL